MREKDLSDKWNQLVSSHFQDLEQKSKAMVSQNDVTDEELFVELDWSVSEARFKELVQGNSVTTYTAQQILTRVNLRPLSRMKDRSCSALGFILSF